MKFFNRLSLKLKLLALSIVTLAISAMGSWYSLSRLTQNYQSRVTDTFTKYPEEVGSKIAAQYFERYGDVQAFAVNDAIKSGDPARMQEPLDSYISLYGIYDLILVVDKKGRYVSSSSKDPSGKKVNMEKLSKMDFSKEPWFNAVMTGATTDDKENAFSGTFFQDFISDSILNVAFGEERFGSSFSSAIRNEKGDIVGIVTNRAGERWFLSELKTQMKILTNSGFLSSEILIFNKDGFVVAQEQSNGSVLDVKLKRNVLKEAQIKSAAMSAEGKNGILIDESGSDTSSIESYAFFRNPKWTTNVGWNIIVTEKKEVAFKSIVSSRNNFMLTLGLSSVMAVLLSFWFSFGLAGRFNRVSKVLNENSAEVHDASVKIAEQASELSEASTKQAAAIQETVAAIDEISAMVEKNAEAAGRSKQVSSDSRSAAENGRKIVDNLLEAINEIDSANGQISTQMEQSNKELSEITKLISDIGSKTKVINEIVFQTKLLSFNASVEAARAGEYGKGFSVVAEEVGNLAQMSGNAAKEITSLLEESIRKVESIVSDSKSRVERLMQLSREKVASGSKTAKECNESLEEILRNVQNVDSLVSEIAVASQEQSTGVQEISKAVGQMEQVTQKNSSVAQNSSVAAEQLNAQAESLKHIVSDLVVQIQGSQSEGHSVNKNNILPITQKRSSKINSSENKTTTEHHQDSFKKVAGSDVTPSADDPGFSE